jgi:cytochrome P450
MELAKLRADPARAPMAVEELMRYEGPTGMMPRRARAEVELRGKTIEPGDRVFLGVAAANHDPDHFADPDRLDLSRPDAGQLGFGIGIHHCLGAALARMEAQVVLRALLRDFTEIRLFEEPVWSSGLFGRNLPRLLVGLQPRHVQHGVARD